jgi:transcription antitermination protein NusB
MMDLDGMQRSDGPADTGSSDGDGDDTGATDIGEGEAGPGDAASGEAGPANPGPSDAGRGEPAPGDDAGSGDAGPRSEPGASDGPGLEGADQVAGGEATEPSGSAEGGRGAGAGAPEPSGSGEGGRRAADEGAASSERSEGGREVGRGKGTKRSRSGQRRTDTGDPRRARERALRMLFQADVRGVEPDVVLRALTDDEAARSLLDDLDELQADVASELSQAQARDDAAAGTTDRPLRASPRIDGFTRSLVLGVADHRDEVDALIARYARKWSIPRMPVVDRSVLRLAAYELLYESTPPAVVIDEAVTLAKTLSTDDSGGYVNGVLESVRKDIAATRQRSPSA